MSSFIDQSNKENFDRAQTVCNQTHQSTRVAHELLEHHSGSELYPTILHTQLRNFDENITYTSANSSLDVYVTSPLRQHNSHQDHSISPPQNLLPMTPKPVCISTEYQNFVQCQATPESHCSSSTNGYYPHCVDEQLHQNDHHPYAVLDSKPISSSSSSSSAAAAATTTTTVPCQTLVPLPPSPWPPHRHSENGKDCFVNAGTEAQVIASECSHLPAVPTLSRVESYSSIVWQSVSRQASVRGNSQCSPSPGGHAVVAVEQSPTLTSHWTSAAVDSHIRPHPVIPFVLGVIASLCCFWLCGVPAIVLSCIALKRWSKARKASHRCVYARPPMAQSLGSTPLSVRQPNLADIPITTHASTSTHTKPAPDAGPLSISASPAPPVETALRVWSVARERASVQLMTRVALVLALLGLACAALNIGFWVWFGVDGRQMFSSSGCTVSAGSGTTQRSSSAASCTYSTSDTSQQYFCYLHRAPGASSMALTCCCRLRGGDLNSLGCVINGSPAVYSECSLQCGM